MARTGYNLYKRKDGRWEGRYRKGYKENGSIAYGYVYAKTFAEARAKLKAKLVQIVPNISSQADAYLGDVARSWLAHKAIHIKKSTYSRYQEALRNHILPWLEKCKLTRLSRTELDRFYRAKLQSGRMDKKGGLSPKTVRDLLSKVSSILKYAKEQGFEVNGISTIPYPKETVREARVLAKHEQMALERVLLEETDRQKLGILLSLYTGLRIGEICALQWGDISLREQVVYVHKTVQRTKNANEKAGKTVKQIDTPKSSASIRQVPLSIILTECLSRHQGKEKAYVLSGSEKVIPEPRTLQRRFKECLQNAGMEDANFHALRHTFATRCVEAGVDVKSLSEMLGHANANITLNRYVHSTIDQKRTCVSKLEQYMSA